jgi:hypothetical protein
MQRNINYSTNYDRQKISLTILLTKYKFHSRYTNWNGNIQYSFKIKAQSDEEACHLVLCSLVVPHVSVEQLTNNFTENHLTPC